LSEILSKYLAAKRAVILVLEGVYDSGNIVPIDCDFADVLTDNSPITGSILASSAEVDQATQLKRGGWL
jgi:hypothetical protein